MQNGFMFYPITIKENSEILSEIENLIFYGLEHQLEILREIKNLKKPYQRKNIIYFAWLEFTPRKGQDLV